MSKSSKKTTSLPVMANYITAVLIVLALVLSYFAYQKFITPGSSQGKSAQKNPSPKAAQEINPQNPALLRNDLTPQEKEALNTPNPDDPDEVKMEFEKKVAAVAQQTDEIDVTDCQPKPPVVKTELGKEFILKNSSDKDLHIVFNQERQYTVGKSSQTTAKADFEHAGIYAYGCDGSAQAVGIIYVLPSQ